MSSSGPSRLLRARAVEGLDRKSELARWRGTVLVQCRHTLTQLDGVRQNRSKVFELDQQEVTRWIHAL